MIKPPPIVAMRKRKQSVESFLAAMNEANSLTKEYEDYKIEEEKKFSSPNGRHTLALLPNIKAPNLDGIAKQNSNNVSLKHSSPKSRRSLPILGSFKNNNIRRDRNQNSVNRNLSWAMKNKNVKSRREALEKQKLQVKLESIHNKKIRINAFKEKNKEQKIQRQWLQVIPIVQSYNKFLNAFHRIRQHNANQILLEERHRAATILQNQSRKRYAAKMKARFEGVAKILIKYEWKARLNLRSTQRQRYAMRIRRFFRDYGGNTKFASIVKSFRYKVILAQRCARDFIATRKARLYAMNLKWLSLETVYVKRLEKTMTVIPTEDGNILSNRDAKIIEESRREIATLVEQWKKTKDKLLTLVDYKEQYESSMSGKSNQTSTKSSHRRIKELLESAASDTNNKNKTLTIPSKIRQNAVENILKYERKRFIIGDYSNYRLEKAYYSPSKPKMKKMSTIDDASLWLKAESPIKGKKKNNKAAEEEEVYEEIAAPPTFPTWKYYSGFDEENFYDQMTMAYQETKIRAAQKDNGIDLFR